jgi:hypothetical protein
MKVSGQLHVPVALPSRKELFGTNSIGGWVGPEAVLDSIAKKNRLW